MTRLDPAAEAQARAADPGASVWLAANAGSGKTTVLTSRVARLLVEGVAPARILCLTYTKAAASEMQNRLFRRLGGWAMAPDAALVAELARLGLPGPLPAARLRAVRRLFAAAIETPGGLKIQTIHAFAAALLRRFPVEAGVSPGFVELDGREADLLRAAVLEELAVADPGALDALAALRFEAAPSEFLAELTARRAAFARPLDAAAAAGAFGLPPGYNEGALLSDAFDGSEGALLPAVVSALRRGSARDQRDAGRLADLLPWTADIARLVALEGILLFGETAKAPFTARIGAFPTQATRAALGAQLAPLEALMVRVEAARPRRLALAGAERTAALHRFAGAFLPRYAAAKAARGRLDFDDLILTAANLLADPGRASWVLWRLDGGIDHILVDEAQDTSPAQWRLIEALAEEMTAGQGARDAARTLFVVGDRKQSIYRFQGADLAAFDATHARFRDRLASAPRPLLDLTLERSFRSSPAILNVVDLTFDARRGAGLGGEVKHVAHLADLPGRVDIWPPVPSPARPETPAWFDPVDRIGADAAPKVLARLLAEELRRLIAAGTPIPTRDGVQRLRAGHVLILVRRRSALFAELIRACKAAGLPVAGADRLRVGAELAVRDLTALLSFLALPEDDLSLAAALRSPLFGWSEAALEALAAPRAPDMTLWEALRRAGEDAAATRAVLDDLRRQTDFLRPYDLVERMLTRHDGRRKLLARLGPEAEDGIDAFLGQALAYERAEVPSLTGFLAWLSTGELEVRRQLDAADDRLRVMTVHGAKGLEAPVVILPDTADRRDPRAPPLLEGAVGPFPAFARDEAPAAAEAALAEEERRRAEEDRRLLYVAATRAQSWLIVAAAGETKAEDGWHRALAAGVEAAGAVRIETPAGPGRRHAHAAWPETCPAGDGPAPATATVVPGWALHPPAAAAAAPAPLSPSDLGGPKALPEEGEAGDAAAALRRGTALHLLLEHLPDWAGLAADARAERARDLLALAEEGLTGAEIDEVLREAEAVRAAPALARLFAPGTLAEVEIAAALPELGGRRILGKIDRLIVADDRVQAIDYKSNRRVPATAEEVPEGLLRQMGAYASALGQVFPGRRVETALLWTRLPGLMPLPGPLVMAALRRAHA